MSQSPSPRELANAVRFLAMDAVQQANSGHPGAPMGMADFAQVVWCDFMKHNPTNPAWWDRDRLVLSGGHASMLLYAMLHLSGYDLSLDDIKNFRQLHSRTPGHPEYGLTPGVETTTGPLGQGICNAVGFALAEKILAATYNRPGHPVVDHNTYCFLGDGDLMEGISHEACSLAGTLKLGKLIALWDDNRISIEGNVDEWFADDTAKRFEAYGWHVVACVDGHDAEAVRQAVAAAKAETERPSIICCRTEIGHGAPTVCGSERCHGSPLGAEEIEKARENLGWPHEPFHVPDALYAGWDLREKGAQTEASWDQAWAAYAKEFPELAEEFARRMRGELPANWEEESGKFIAGVRDAAEDKATRKASQAALNGYGPLLPELLGGSADLAGSNGTLWSGSKHITPNDAAGNNMRYGVREFAMGAIMNALTLHGGFIPFGGTFLVFSDYMRNAMRLAALMELRTIYVLTHDSIGVGEDGPTHQPVEHVSSLRIMPNMDVWRPCDTVETAVAWKCAIESEKTPSSLVLSRQGLPFMQRNAEQVENIVKGGYILRDAEDGNPEAIIIATGSEVSLAMSAADALARKGRSVRVVSMPCADRFDQQDDAYKLQVLPAEVEARVAVEAGSTGLWFKYVGGKGTVIGMDRYGESAPGKTLFEFFGFTVDNVVEAVESVLGE
ncbi:transketolase [Oceanidesulfovibrio indonesiensis]|uniref:Transketolase n=1 Tax=Oceanidesulfovibrio indonesiensis TaxID=54767 RepID=A0A7M3MF98_9BACT|nr:transketolase [Oceanidesulfovibrio indonesiensis]TVM17602.1 transketolase [Oceanidesulfovibrio indonesiensis]